MRPFRPIHFMRPGFLPTLVALGAILLLPPDRAAQETVPAASGPVSAATPGITVVAGEIEGALFTLARPAQWNRKVLLLAHGLIDEGSKKIAALDIRDTAYARLLDEGWLIASTSYRRNGVIVRDAIADVNALRDHIERTEGRPQTVLLYGVSMGGAVVTLIAENEPGRYQGVVAVGVATQARDPQYPLAFTSEPKIPILFLANQSELERPTTYIGRVPPTAVQPALWTVARDGHANVNSAEVAAALDGLIGWVETGSVTLRRDATVLVATPPGDTTIEGDTAHGRVDSITANNGNLFTTFRPGDFEKLGIAKGDTFELTAGGKTYTVRYGTTYGDVPRGEWVAFLRAEGLILLARNYGNAAETTGIQPGDALAVRALKKP